MTSKYTYNSNGFIVPVNSEIPLNTVANQAGNCTTSVTDGIQINGAGQYRITATVSGLITGGGILRFAVLNNGNNIATLIGQAYTDTAQPQTITVSDVIKVKCNCCQIQNYPTVITLENTSGSPINLLLASLNVEKIK